LQQKHGGLARRELPTPIWDSFLDCVSRQHTELQAYLQRAAGYWLTGQTTEYVLFFLYGTGANEKGIFTRTLVGIWAVTAPMETFLEGIGDRHPTELGMLRGARLVVAQETEQGRRWAEAKIKQMTGGDKIAAQFMWQDFLPMCLSSS
jgi:putative DNA primase/helicase